MAMHVAAVLDRPETWRSRRIKVEYGKFTARVELDRDNWMESGQHEDRKLSDDFRQAADRCMHAGIDRLWLDGETRSFSWGSGDHYVTLFVPVRHADEAVRALRTAETRGDMRLLDRLADKLAPPYDQWLTPGERKLQLGVDFRCPPARLVKLLRAEASRRKMRANARQVEDGVWVRPEPTATAKLLRQAFPDQYIDDPLPVPVQSSKIFRPPIDRRERSRSRTAVPVRPLSFDMAAPPACPCGYTRSHIGFSHDQWHAHWSIGVALPESLSPRTGIVVVTPQASSAWCRVAWESSQVARRQGHYDAGTWPTDRGTDVVNDEDPCAYLALAEGRAVGYLAVSHADRHGWLEWDTDGRVELIDHTIRPRVNIIHVVQVWRRRGLARRLVESMAADSGVALGDVSWSTPFSSTGGPLARSLSANGVWVS
ncbi:hypothetical protein AB0F73_04635 [Micromonospora purpureochromogenes]|uniref:hypothetical protein n=1 Tax=Micromonospora purpureochromogenes TaxID=47872 RepID=UPI0033DE57A8